MSEMGELQPTVVRNKRGLSIHGTRITLYDVMDYLHTGLSPEEIQEWLPLTEPQVAAAMEYIATHRAEVDAEYHQVLAKAEENVMRRKVCCLLPATAYRSLGARSAVRGPQGGNLVAELCRHNFMTHDTSSRTPKLALMGEGVEGLSAGQRQSPAINPIPLPGAPELCLGIRRQG